ncbi:carboxypeptidase regulatory-like domain-containing protein [Aeromicrobium endophyticum]|uniref:Alpha-amylase n=1 Tax=Aeromicrobium endophyticum TaxID=2292704 RepID=A0A371P3L9_9ACTN|nr:carboxypeptidase regulatory-like domain-containing protein [Aeromicrobium endophyticum]REK70539.1 hypothetical protein DX116_15545 [Aeromicrobium endophyticum]
MKTPTIVRAGAALTAAGALVLAGLMSPASAASSTANLKGTVTLGGQPVDFAKVQLYPLVLDRSNDEYEVGQRLKTDNTDSRGRYSFSGLTATSSTTNRYVVLVTDRTSKGVKTYRTIVAKKGKTLTQNVNLKAASALVGTVKRSDGRPATGLTVSVNPGQYNDQGESYEKLYPEWSAPVNADGTYALRGIPGGNYDEVIVSDGLYAKQCIDFVASALGDCVTGTDGAAYAKQRVTLAPGDRALPAVTMTKSAPAVTTLKGKVTDSSGRPLKGIGVRIYTGQFNRVVTTRSSGRYTLKDSFPAGAYSIRFDDHNDVWASQFFGGGTDRKTRQRVTVVPGTPISGLDTKLKSRVSVKTATKGGTGTAKVAVRITRAASSKAPGGTLTLSFEGRSKSVDVVKGRAVVTLSGLPSGSQPLTATYSGTSSTAGATKALRVTVK